ncbi:MAG: ABC transporter ATP-binding protein [Bacilli bacterium]|nr:ABC transporter ATP-binding protein [Bacilli bacterium]
MDTKSFLLQLLSNKIKLIISLVLTVSFIVLCEIFGVILLKQIIELVIIGGYQNELPLRMTLFVLAVVASFIFTIWKKRQTSVLSSYVFSNLATRAYTLVLEAEIQELSHDNVREATSRIVDNSRAISDQYLAGNIVKLAEKIIYLVAIFITMMAIKPILGLILYASLPVFFITIKALEKYVNKAKSIENKTVEESVEIIKDSYNKIKDIKLLNGIKYEKERFSEWTEEYTKNKTKSDLSSGLVKVALQDFFVGVIFSIILGLGSWLASDASFGITTGTILIFAIFVPSVYVAFKSVMSSHIYMSFVSKERDELDLLYNLRSEVKSEPVNSLEEIHSLKFIDVNYSFDKKNIVIDNISFELKRGERLGILSDDGCSKRYILDMMTKLVKPTKGSISINNCDILKINTSYLRDLITSIFDGNTVFDGTIEENIIYPAEFDEYKYNDALNRSGLKEIILELPNKEKTLISEDTKDISQDILQRIIFANAFYKDSKIYVLNDATKSFNLGTENELIKEVFKLKNKIIVMMTDKVYNLSLCDKIVILENGKVVEYGKYSDLLQDKSSTFYKLIKKATLSKKEKVS